MINPNEAKRLSPPASPAADARTFTLKMPGLAPPLRLWRPPSVDALLERMDVDAPGAEERIPYWAELWPSAEGLARWLLAGRGPRRPGRALEIGCGLGLAGLVALRAGWDLRLGDRDPEAVRWAAANLARNGFSPARAVPVDWNAPPPGRVDTVLAADVLYEAAFAGPLLRFLDAALAPRGLAVIAEPGRPVADAFLGACRREFELSVKPWRSRGGGRWRPLRILTLRRRA
jgi:predicted nicotinamide N-methyase